MKFQIALDYLIIFNFVIFLFLIVFVAVSYQRGQATNQETFSQLQTIAQTVAVQISAASTSGNGYSAHIALPASISIINYNLYISNTGLVVVSVNTNGQIIQALSYSLVKRIISNSTFETSTNANLYNIPTANGSVELQNSYGNICVDYQCPLPVNQSSIFTVSDIITHGALFNGGNALIQVVTPDVYTPNAISYSSTTGVSTCLWFDPETVQVVQSPFAQVNTSGGTLRSYLGFQLPSNTQIGAKNFTHLRYFTSSSTNILGHINIYANNWYFACGVVNGAGIATTYINGVQDTTSTGMTLSTRSNTGTVTIGAQNNNTVSTAVEFPYFFNGIITNVQMYNTSLSGSQVSQLYLEGINGQPVSKLLVGWWTLDGVVNDSSGNGNTGNVFGPVLFPTVAQIFALPLNSSGQPLSNTLVGFITNAGNFSTGRVAVNYTNSSGVAKVIITQGKTSGNAFVKATSFQGGAGSGSLIGWWPLNLGEGNIAHDISGNGNMGTIVNGSWSKPNSVLHFDGQTGYLDIGTPKGGVAGYSSSTFAYWIYPRTITPLSKLGGGSGVASINLPANQWTFVTVTNHAGTVNVMVDGALASSNTGGVTPMTGLVGPSFVYGTSGYVGAGSSYNDSLSNMQIYNSILSTNQISQLYINGLGSPPLATSSLIGWYPLSGDANDYSGNGNNASIEGGASFSSTAGLAQGNNTQAIVGVFNGTNAYINGTGIHAFPLSNFEWIYPTAYPSSSEQVASFNLATPLANGDALQISNNGNLIESNNPGGTGLTTALVVPLNQWSLVGFSASSTAITVYLDGQSQSTSVATTPPSTSSNDFSIGALGTSGGAGKWFKGYITNVQIYGAIVNGTQVDRLYTSGLAAPPLQNKGLVGWYPILPSSGNSMLTNDYSGLASNAIATKVGYKLVSLINPPNLNSFGSSGITFNGAKSVIKVPSVTYSGQNTGLTVSTWVLLNANTVTDTGPQGIINLTRSAGSEGTALVATASNVIFYPDRTHSTVFLTANYPMIGNWNQVVAVWNYTAPESGALYINGVQVANTVNSAPSVSNIIKVTIGNYNGNFLNGSIANVQLFSTAMNASQVYQLYDNSPPQGSSTVVPFGLIR